ncbi:hypothetical protein HMPREF9080_03045 [Cardiobacterium valvarum F0432]|uniref:Uncharacterized protein n=2 Tax=Cardiobacterium valvarum TaxID=194702 RepID=G9ZJS5_9GAMM|nr:hypothetical protein HMPREF9080_03045 [Cardiobacterium valvarum F0432]
MLLHLFAAAFVHRMANSQTVITPQAIATTMRYFTHNRRTSMTTIRSALLTAALFAGSAAVAAPVKYDIDPTHFYVQIGVSHLGYSTIPGLFKGVSGSLYLRQRQR